MTRHSSLAIKFALLTLLPAATATVCAEERLPWRAPSPATPAEPVQVGANDAYRPSYGADDGYRSAPPSDDAYRPAPGTDDAYRPADGANDAYRPDPYANRGTPNGAPQAGNYGGPYGSPPDDSYRPQNSGGPTYGEPYSAAPDDGSAYAPPPAGAPQDSGQGYEQGEIVAAGHRFFGSISQGLASAVEHAFQSQGRPNGYILGEDAGGAFVLGLRYGEGTLYTKDAGTHKVFWQGPSLGYDAGAEGSKTMVLVYNLRDPSEIYERFGGVQGSAYFVGGVSVQYQRYNDVTLAVIRSGVGLRLGANVGYLKYTRSPTWNPL